jgi:hypothetical protein
MRSPRPRWVLPAAAVAVALAAAVAVALVVRDDGGGTAAGTTSTTVARSRLAQAAALAAIDVDGVERADVEAMIEELCSSRDGGALAALVVDAGVSAPDDVRAVVEGVGRGAAGYCPEVPADQPQLVNDAYNAALELLEDGADE